MILRFSVTVSWFGINRIIPHGTERSVRKSSRSKHSEIGIERIRANPPSTRNTCLLLVRRKSERLRAAFTSTRNLSYRKTRIHRGIDFLVERDPRRYGAEATKLRRARARARRHASAAPLRAAGVLEYFPPDEGRGTGGRGRGSMPMR